MKHTKLAAIILSAVIACTALVSCGNSDLETDVFSVTAPSGWCAVKRTLDGKEKDDQVYVIKDGEVQTDSMNHPSILVSYYKDPSEYVDTKSFYKDSKDISSFKEGDLTWEGYTYTDFGTPSACLKAKDGSAMWVCVLILEKGDGKISVEDEDVKSVLSSLKAK